MARQALGPQANAWIGGGNAINLSMLNNYYFLLI
jgi:hypothetical protein